MQRAYTHTHRSIHNTTKHTLTFSPTYTSMENTNTMYLLTCIHASIQYTTHTTLENTNNTYPITCIHSSMENTQFVKS